MPSPGCTVWSIEPVASRPVAFLSAWRACSMHRTLPSVRTPTRSGGAMLATDVPMVLLRIVHIATGVIWVAWHLYPSFSDWTATNFGKALTVGGLLAISGLDVAGSVTRPTIRRLVKLGTQVAESGGPPAPETAARIGALQRRLVVGERASFSLVLLAVVFMSSARYL